MRLPENLEAELHFAARKGSQYLTKCRIFQSAVGLAEIRMIEEVEEFGSELYL